MDFLKIFSIEDADKRMDSIVKSVLQDTIPYNELIQNKRDWTYLLNKGFSEKTVYYVIDKLKEYNYINDEEYVKRYLEIKSRTEGKRLSDYKLMMKGVKKSDIIQAREGFDDNSKENALNIATRKMKNKEPTRENLSKVYRYLIGKGFSYEDAEYAISFFRGEM